MQIEINQGPPPPSADRLRVMFAALASLGMPKEAVAILADKADIGLATDDRRYFEGPIVVSNAGGWDADIPKWMLPQIAAERGEIVFGKNGLLVGPTEIAAVMFAATMVSPIQRDFADLYVWASANAAARHFERDVGHYYAQMQMDRPIAYEDVVFRGGRLWHVYQETALEIRRKVIAHQTARDGTRRREERAAAITATGPAPKVQERAIVVDQFLMF